MIVLFLAVILLGMVGYVSLSGFIKPLGWQLVNGYYGNNVPEDSSTYDRIITIRNEIESSFNNVFYKNEYIELNGLAQRILGRRIVCDADRSNDVVKLDNGYLTFVGQKIDIDWQADNIKRLHDILVERETDFLYVLAPYKIDPTDPELPYVIDDYNNENADILIDHLRYTGIDCIDLREEIKSADKNHYEMFFLTDHHWTPESGFWAFGVIGRHLNERYGFSIDESLFYVSSYRLETKENWFLGSLGKRVGTLYGGVDDFTYLLPKFETDFEVLWPLKDVIKFGSFEKVLFDKKLMEERDYTSNTYTIYTDDYELQIIKNNLNTEKRVLLVRDSFACVVSPFLSLGCKQLDVMDLRHYNDKSLIEYIDETNPDIVIILYNPGTLANHSGGEKLYDFY